ncbi:MAG: MlaD family protein [Rhizobiaceae bacterium]
METRANYVLVGLFTLLATIAIFGFVYWTARIGDTGQTTTLRIRIPGSAAGLSRGSFVLFNGVRVGDVNRVYIDVSNPSVAIADATIDMLTPITKSTRGSVGIVGLTGTTNVELRGGDPREENILTAAAEAGTVPEIVVEPSVVTNILESATSLMDRANGVLDGLEKFVQDAREPLTETLRNTEKFSEALAENSDNIDDFLASAGRLADTLTQVTDPLENTLKAAEELLQKIDSEKVGAILANVDEFTGKLNTAADDIDVVMDNFRSASDSIAGLSDRANGALGKVEEILGNVDGKTVQTAITNISEASDSAKTVADDISKVTGKFAERAEEVDKIIADIGTLSDRLSKASERIEGVMNGVDAAVASIADFSDKAGGTLQKVDGIIENVDPQEVKAALNNIAEASETARTAVADVAKVTTKFGERAEDVDKIMDNAGQLAERLNKASERVDGVLAKLDGVLGSDDAEGVIAEARQTLQSFREVAETLNARAVAITDGLARFSGQGLRDVEALVRDSRRSIARIEQAISDLERNPQRILTGGEGSVRRYDGRRRR